jgi:hypothetical protein
VALRVLGHACNVDDSRRHQKKGVDDRVAPTATAVLLPMIPSFLSCLFDDVREVRMAAVQVLGTLDLHLHAKECAQCSAQLKRLIQGDTSVVVRAAAAEVIKQLEACIAGAGSVGGNVATGTEVSESTQKQEQHGARADSTRKRKEVPL